ncbi:hypothetical protein [Proteus mirabilis]|uniref:hypothetical protein n=1 Tax=Proteus mirabilis TaxID=584 RepID=UPI00319E1C64
MCVGSGANLPPEKVMPEKEAFPINIKCIDGYAYYVGPGRDIYKRIDIGQWQQIQNGIPESKFNTDMGFDDLDGFSEQDMYAVGGACDDYRLQCWNGKEMVRPKDGDKNVIASGHMDVRDGILVVADDYNVDLYDGTAWHKIVRPYK